MNYDKEIKRLEKEECDCIYFEEERLIQCKRCMKLQLLKRCLADQERFIKELKEEVTHSFQLINHSTKICKIIDKLSQNTGKAK